MEKKMDLDSFGEIIDRILEENEFQMLLTMPEGTQEVQIKDNVGLGPTIQFYAMLNGIVTVCRTLQKDLELDIASPDWERAVDNLLAMVKADILNPDEE